MKELHNNSQKFNGVQSDIIDAKKDKTIEINTSKLTSIEQMKILSNKMHQLSENIGLEYINARINLCDNGFNNKKFCVSKTYSENKPNNEVKINNEVKTDVNKPSNEVKVNNEVKTDVNNPNNEVKVNNEVKTDVNKPSNEVKINNEVKTDENKPNNELKVDNEIKTDVNKSSNEVKINNEVKTDENNILSKFNFGKSPIVSPFDKYLRKNVINDANQGAKYNKKQDKNTEENKLNNNYNVKKTNVQLNTNHERSIEINKKIDNQNSKSVLNNLHAGNVEMKKSFVFNMSANIFYNYVSSYIQNKNLLSQIYHMVDTNYSNDNRRVRSRSTLSNISNDTSRMNSNINSSSVFNCHGVLELVHDDYGFLRSSENNYLISNNDIYISCSFIKTYGLRMGDCIVGKARSPQGNEKYQTLTEIETINGKNPEDIKSRAFFDSLTPLFPNRPINLVTDSNQFSMRIMSIFTPVGFGQRGVIVAPPKSGKTILLKEIAHAISTNHPNAHLIVLLIGERPEEVTDMRRSVRGEVIASTFDEQAERQIKVTNMVIEKAKRLVECGTDVIILLDSITRLARASNVITPSSGKVLTGGVDAKALDYPKKIFGTARNIEQGGSLTILATALIETGSKMDDVIFEEFKGTSNMELQLDRKLANRRTYPAIDVLRSSTRREEILIDPSLLSKTYLLRKFLSEQDNSVENIEFLLDKMKFTKNNEEFFNAMNSL